MTRDDFTDDIVNHAVSGAYDEIPVLKLTRRVILVIALALFVLFANAGATSWEFWRLSSIANCQQKANIQGRTVAAQDRGEVDKLVSGLVGLINEGPAAPPDGLSKILHTYQEDRAANERQRAAVYGKTCH